MQDINGEETHVSGLLMKSIENTPILVEMAEKIN